MQTPLKSGGECADMAIERIAGTRQMEITLKYFPAKP
jgi:hypothetical protein